jgi:hypothetical protein
MDGVNAVGRLNLKFTPASAAIPQYHRYRRVILSFLSSHITHSHGQREDAAA